MFLIHYSSERSCFYFSINSWSFSFLLILSSLNFSFISFIFLWKNLRISAYCSINIFEVLCWIDPIFYWIYLCNYPICCIRFLSELSKFVFDLYKPINTLFNLEATQLYFDIESPFTQISVLLLLSILPMQIFYPVIFVAHYLNLCTFIGNHLKSFIVYSYLNHMK